MISQKKLEAQLKQINFHYKGWGRSEAQELRNIIMPSEEIEECVNGYYEAGFALLVSTKDRVLLVDKKPLGYLTVHDMRFDMINELDLHHRLMGAQIRISAGSKTLHFTSLNQVRLRRLLNYVQNRMTQIKKDQDDHQNTQRQHMEEMNEQLRLYLMAAHKQQYVDQANTIATINNQPTIPLPPVPPQPLFEQTPVLQQQPAVTAATPFEQAAAVAFDAQLGQQEVKPAVEPTQQSALAQIMSAVPKYSHQALKQAEQMVMTPQQIGMSAAKRVVPVISAYTRLPLISQRRRFGNQTRTPDAV